MKKNILAMLFIAFGAMSLFAQRSNFRNVSNFYSIDLEGNADLYLIKGDTQSVEIECRNGWHDQRIITKVRGNTLCVFYEDDWFRDRGNFFSPFPRYRIYITYTELDEIDLEGRIRIHSDGPLEADKMEVDLSGYITGEMTIYARHLELDTEGYVKLFLDGETQSQEISMEGLGRIEAEGLFTDYCEVDIDGSTNLHIYVREELEADVGGVASITYSGNPKIRHIDRDGWVRVRACRY